MAWSTLLRFSGTSSSFSSSYRLTRLDDVVVSSRPEPSAHCGFCTLGTREFHNEMPHSKLGHLIILEGFPLQGKEMRVYSSRNSTQKTHEQLASSPPSSLAHAVPYVCNSTVHVDFSVCHGIRQQDRIGAFLHRNKISEYIWPYGWKSSLWGVAVTSDSRPSNLARPKQPRIDRRDRIV